MLLSSLQFSSVAFFILHVGLIDFVNRSGVPINHCVGGENYVDVYFCYVCVFTALFCFFERKLFVYTFYCKLNPS